MPKFSANLGFLWKETPLPQAIRAAKQAGFDAVECHWPYKHEPSSVKAALEEAGLEMLSLNTAPGDLEKGEFGLCALPDRVCGALDAIEEAIDYACVIGTKSVHLMAGKAKGKVARNAFIANLRHASKLASRHVITCLIEPVNTYDVPGYFLNDLEQAVAIIHETNRDNVRLMFDVYHILQMGLDPLENFKKYQDQIAHVQFAGFPQRNEPDRDEYNYKAFFAYLDEIDWQRPIGAEYHPSSKIAGTEDAFGWMQSLSNKPG